MSFVAVLPSIYPPWTQACLDSCRFPREHLLLVDNTTENRGVAASWNLGVETVLREGQDWLVILSAAMRFGDAGGLDFLELLEANPDAWALEAHPHFGWHLIGFHRRTLEGVGYFDENFWPAYWEDNDFSYRFALLRDLIPVTEPFWRKVEVDATLAGYAHGHRLAGVQMDAGNLLAYYVRKWGGAPSEEQFRHPFGDETLDLTWWPDQRPERSIR